MGICKNRFGARAEKGLRRSEVVPLALINVVKSRAGPDSVVSRALVVEKEVAQAGAMPK
jgi:hypothetical protein